MYSLNSVRFIPTIEITLLLGSSVTAQSPAVLATRLKAPEKLVLTPRGKLLVAEAG